MAHYCAVFNAERMSGVEMLPARVPFSEPVSADQVIHQLYRNSHGIFRGLYKHRQTRESKTIMNNEGVYESTLVLYLLI